MPLVAVLRDEQGTEQRGLNDPTGGTFDAAGDFDALIPPHPDTDDYRLLGAVEPQGDTIFKSAQMADLLADLDRLRPATPISERGVARLRRMAELCRDDMHLYICFVGD